MAIGASGPAPGEITVAPTVKTRKKVPMNSTRYFFIGVSRALWGTVAPERVFFGVADGAE